jgi:dihydroneopterin aldolase
MLDSIFIRDLNIDCIIGVNSNERTRAQRVVVQIELLVDTEAAAARDSLQHTVDYESVTAQALFLFHLGQFKLLETACHVLCRTLLLPPSEGERRAAVERVRVRMDKPDGLRGQALPGVEVSRSRADVNYATRQLPYGTVSVVHETPDMGVYHKSILPGANVPIHLHPGRHEAEMFVSTGIAVNESLAAAGSVRIWPANCPHGYRNTAAITQSVLSLSRPAHRPGDEVPVQADVATVNALSAQELGTRNLDAWLHDA